MGFGSSPLGHWEKDVPMRLTTLLKQYDPSLTLDGLPDVEVGGVQEDSRLVRPGDLFVARPGTKTDGGKFLADAKARGAVGAVVQERVDGCELPQIVTSDAAAAASILANLCFGRPSEEIKVLAVTGTNGKTTTAYLVRHLLGSVNKRCGLVGTVEIDIGHSKREAAMTTPGSIEVAQLLATMRDKGCRGCAIEVSSHALDQKRVAGVHFSGAAFTNLTGDHLDYHKTMDAYAAAKAKLFESLDPAAVAVVNVDDEYADRMVRDTQARVIRFGFGKTAD